MNRSSYRKIIFCLSNIIILGGCAEKGLQSNKHTPCEDSASLSIAKELELGYDRENFETISNTKESEQFYLTLTRSNKIIYKAKYDCKYLDSGSVSLTSQTLFKKIK